MSESYWQRNRLSRRRFLFAVASAGAGAAALAIAGCGGAGTDQTPTALLSFPENTTPQAKAGGTFKTYIANDASTFDPLNTSSALTWSQVAAYGYPRLLKFAITNYPQRPTGEVEGDLAESIEWSGDRLQLTVRLRQGPKWDARAPTNGRAIDAQDVVFSWNKFARLHPNRNEVVYSANEAPGASFESIRMIDARTVAFKMRQPDATAPALLASDALFYVMPRESEGGYDPSREVRGYGPWTMIENQPGIYRLWSRNPDYYFKDRPFPDRLEQVVIGEYSTRLAQFRAGLIWTNVASQSDILSTKREIPELLLRKTDNFSTAPSSLAFGYDGNSPWKDERLRQAVSRLIDRETLIDLKTKRAEFAANGIDLDVRYHTAITAGWDGYWVNPLDSTQFGQNGRFYSYDPHEAQTLLRAANYGDGLDTVLHYNAGSESPGYARNAELISGLLLEGGIRATLDPRDPNDWSQNYFYGYASAANGNRPSAGFPGIIYRTVPNYAHPVSQLFATMHRQGTRFHGMTPDGKNANQGDPDVNRMIEEMRKEFDAARQRTLALDFARFMAQKSYDIPMLPYATNNLSLTWPVIANQGAHIGWPGGNPVTEAAIHQWIDTSKPPLAAAVTTS